MVKIGDYFIFSMPDFHLGYCQILLATVSEELIGFTILFGHYHFKVMLLSLHNAPNTS